MNGRITNEQSRLDSHDVANAVASLWAGIYRGVIMIICSCNVLTDKAVRGAVMDADAPVRTFERSIFLFGQQPSVRSMGTQHQAHHARCADVLIRLAVP